MNDKQLYRLCKKYGVNALLWKRKFAGLLPEVLRRQLHEKKGFSSIFEFAAKLCGMSKDQVNLVLNLGRRFETMPSLSGLLTRGDASMNKLARVVSIATPENESMLAQKIQQHSQAAVEVMVRDFKNNNGSGKPQIEIKGLRAQTLDEGLNLRHEVREKLLELQRKGFDVNDLLLKFLEKREADIAEEKQEIQLTLESKHDAALVNGGRSVAGRAIPAAVKRIIEKEFGTKCAIPSCLRQSKETHHTARFSLSNNHDPFYLAPLCKGHHELAHGVDLRAREKWQARVATG